MTIKIFYKKVEYIEAGNKRVKRWRKICCPKGTKLQLCKMNKPIDLLCNMVPILDNPVLHTGNLLRQDFRYSYHTHTHTHTQ